MQLMTCVTYDSSGINGTNDMLVFRIMGNFINLYVESTITYSWDTGYNILLAQKIYLYWKIKRNLHAKLKYNYKIQIKLHAYGVGLPLAPEKLRRKILEFPCMANGINPNICIQYMYAHLLTSWNFTKPWNYGLCFHVGILNVLLYLFWKLNTLIEKAKVKPKSTQIPTWTAATTPRKSCL